MQSTEDLRGIQAAIDNEILPGLREVVQHLDSPPEFAFDKWHISNDRCRTPEHLILETISLGGGSNQIIKALHTPLGSLSLDLCAAGFETLQLSKRFLDSFDWEITDVTDRVVHYHYYQAEDTA